MGPSLPLSAHPAHAWGRRSRALALCCHYLQCHQTPSTHPHAVPRSIEHPKAHSGHGEGMEICMTDITQQPRRGHCHRFLCLSVPPPAPRGEHLPCPALGMQIYDLPPLPHDTLRPPSAHGDCMGPCPSLQSWRQHLWGLHQPLGARRGRGGGGAAGPRQPHVPMPTALTRCAAHPLLTARTWSCCH